MIGRYLSIASFSLFDAQGKDWNTNSQISFDWKKNDKAHMCTINMTITRWTMRVSATLAKMYLKNKGWRLKARRIDFAILRLRGYAIIFIFSTKVPVLRGASLSAPSALYPLARLIRTGRQSALVKRTWHASLRRHFVASRVPSFHFTSYNIYTTRICTDATCDRRAVVIYKQNEMNLSSIVCRCSSTLSIQFIVRIICEIKWPFLTDSQTCSPTI